LTPEERLRRREEEKRKIKEQLKLAKAASPNDVRTTTISLHFLIKNTKHKTLKKQTH
jgi:hypothetical protein